MDKVDATALSTGHPLKHINVIVVRSTMLAESLGAHMWHTHKQAEVVAVSPSEKLSDSVYVERLTGKNVLIVGGYFRVGDHPVPDEIFEVCSSLSIFVSESDFDLETNERYVVIRPLNDHSGFATWSFCHLQLVDLTLSCIVRYLDAYLYGYPSEEVLCFQNGLYMINRKSDLDRVLSLKNMHDVNDAIDKGRGKWIANQRTVETRVRTSKQFRIISPFLYSTGCTVLVSVGDSPILETCMALAEASESGIGVLFRYDLAQKKTFVTMRTTETSGIHAGRVMKELMNGGGNKVMGGRFDGWSIISR